MVEARLDAIADSHSSRTRLIETERDKIPSPWGFVPRDLGKRTFAAIAADVKAHPKFYDEPLKDFEDKLITAARKWARYHDLEWGMVKQHLEANVWPKLLKNGKPIFSCTKIKTESPTLLAWRLEWNGK